MKRLSLVSLFVLLSVALLGLSGCRKKKDVAIDVPPPAPPVTQPQEVPQDDGIGRPEGDTPELVRVPESLMKTIYFDFDRYNIRPDQVQYMEANAKYLVDNPDKRILIEGHCDEQGTLEYNMALGQRRATSVGEFFVSRGVQAERLETVSRGEEMPAVQGTGDSVYALNRRAEFYYVNR